MGYEKVSEEGWINLGDEEGRCNEGAYIPRGCRMDNQAGGGERDQGEQGGSKHKKRCS